MAVCSEIHTKHINTAVWAESFAIQILKIKIYRTITLPVVLYGCETWSLTLEEERRLRVLENRVLGRISGLKGRGNRGWRKLHNEERNDLYCVMICTA